MPAMSGVLLVFGYPPYSIPVIPFVGLVPFFFWIDRPMRVRELLAGAGAFAIPYFGGTLYWMFLLGNATLAGYAGAAGAVLLYLATYAFFPVGMGALTRVRRIPLVLSAPVLWVVSEHARSYGDFYFPWVTLGYALDDWPSLAQHADLVGVYGLSLWLATINAAIASLVARRREPGARTLPAVVLAVSIAVPAVYNPIRWARVERAVAEAPHVNVALLQPNVSQESKWRPETVDAIYRGLNRLVRDAERGDADLVVAPEAAIPLPIAPGAERLPLDIEPGTKPLLVGALSGVGEGEVRRVGEREIRVYRLHQNAAFLAAPDRRVLAWQGKRYLVPVTERIPYAEVFGFLLPVMKKQFGRFVPSDRTTLFEIGSAAGPVRFGSLVCYEVLFPGLVREMRNRGADFFVSIVNDAWFGDTTFPHQHAGISAIRAIENRSSIARSANTGISVAFDPLGRPIATTGLFREAVLETSLPIVRERTVYGRLGDVAVWAAYAVLLGLAFVGWRAHRRGDGLPSAR